MPRTLLGSYRTALETVAPGAEVTLVFATLTHGATVIRVATNDHLGVEFNSAGAVVNYNWSGSLFLGCPIGFELLTDDESPPRGRAVIADPDRSIGLAVLAMTAQVSLKIDVLPLSTFGAISGSTRSGSGTAQVSYQQLFLRNIGGDGTQVEGEISSYDLNSEPYSAIRATKERCPGLWW